MRVSVSHNAPREPAATRARTPPATTRTSSAASQSARVSGYHNGRAPREPARTHGAPRTYALRPATTRTSSAASQSTRTSANHNGSTARKLAGIRDNP